MRSRSPATAGILVTLLACAACNEAPAPVATPASAPAPAPDAAPVGSRLHDVPRLDAITVDGDASDWGDRGFRVEVLIPPSGEPKTVEDFDARVRLAWNSDGLLVLVDTHDDVWREHAKVDELWRRDAIEVFLSPKRGSRDICQWVIAPGMCEDQEQMRSHMYDHRKDEKLKGLPADLTAARKKTTRGYVVEALLPWRALAIEPGPGREVAFQILVNDADRVGNNPEYRATWYPALGTHADPDNAHRLRLSASASEAVSARVSGRYDLQRLRTMITVAATQGRIVEVVDGTRALGRAELARDGRLVTANLALPLPPPGETWRAPAVSIDGEPVGTVALPDVTPMRRRAFEEAEMVFAPFVFSGAAFPPVAYRRPLLVEGLVGPYTITTTFYDSDREIVLRPEKPGRYGAVVEVGTQDGARAKRFFTLYRQSEDMSWWRTSVPITVELPAQLGVDPVVAREQSDVLAGYLKEELRSSFERNPAGAVVLAGLAETAPGTPVTDRTNPWRRDAWWWHRLKKATGDVVPLRYLSHVPPEAETDTGKRFPAILFLHGSGERGDDLKKVQVHGPPKLVAQGEALPFIVISPQCPRGRWWSLPSLDDLLDECMEKYPIDPDRLYLTGLSMGGFGCWALAAEFPDRFAAVVPICGGGDARDVKRLADVPVWVFHGGADGTVPPDRSRGMVEALKAVGGRVRYTEYPGVGHDSWTRSYANPELFEWMLDQRRGEPRQPRATMP